VDIASLSHSSKTNVRAIAEDELRDLGACVLDLAGLYGGEHDPKNWVMRVATTKEQVKGKLALHLVHGADVAWLKCKTVRLNRGTFSGC
jgi:hypothetical protein